MSASNNPFLLYRIWYGEEIVYVGQTRQKLQDRLRGHCKGRPMMRKIDADMISKIEYTKCATWSDMQLYEVYYIAKLKPVRNYEKKTYRDDLTVALPELHWTEYECPLLHKWAEGTHYD